MDLATRIYDAAARAGLLTECRWAPADGGVVESHPVGFSAADGSLLDGLVASTDYVMSFPASCFATLTAGETVTIVGQPYRVREIRAVHDGTELRATLTRI